MFLIDRLFRIAYSKTTYERLHLDHFVGAFLNISHRLLMVHPQAFGRKQCFIHGNGRSRGPMWDLLGSFARSPYGKALSQSLREEERGQRSTDEEGDENPEEMVGISDEIVGCHRFQGGSFHTFQR